MKKILSFFAAFSSVFSFHIYAQNLVSHDFDNGAMDVFFECTTKSPNYARVVNSRLKTYWVESGYDGGRVSKGAEACVEFSDFVSHKETWMGMKMNIANGHRNDTQSGVAQIFQFVDNANIFTWTGMLKYEYGDLRFVRRSGKNTSSMVDDVVVSNLARNQDHDIIIHYVLSGSNAGLVEIWVNGNLEYGAYNINFGFGNFNSNDVQHDDTYVELKIGQYNYQNDEYVPGEERIIYYDNVTWYNGGTEGYDVVNPDDDTSMPPLSNIVHLNKRNAQGFAIDGNHGGDNAQNIYLWSANSANVNQQWVEIDRGNGYFSYQKNGTNYCIDGNHGGANGQNVYLWACQSSNQNQHWKKVSTGGGSYRLEKRNAPGFALDGNRGGENRQNLYLWTIGESNQNQQWIFSGVN